VLFVLLHGEDVTQKPLENVGVTMNTNIDFVVVGDFLQALVEVLHVFHEQASGEVEVALIVFGVINDVDHDVVLEVRSLNRVNQILVGFLVSWLVLGILVVRP
jgi:hypothetical protein